MDTIHTRIKRLRGEAGLSMQALAAAVGLKAWQAVQQWENGETAPSRARLPKVAKALSTTPEYLLSGVIQSEPAGNVARFAQRPDYQHQNPTIARIVELLERTGDIGLGEVLGAAKAAAAEHPNGSRQKAFSSQ